MKSIVVLIILALASVGCSTMQVHNPIPVNKIVEVSDVDQEYFIQVGDSLEIYIPDVTSGISGEGANTITLPVRPDGKILLPLLRREVKVAGYKPSAVVKRLKQEYSTMVRNPQVMLNIVLFAPRMVYVTGEVGASQAIPYTNTLTALRATAMGGYDVLRASLTNVIVVRDRGIENKPHVIALNLHKAITNENIRHDIRLMPNDVVIVPKKGVVAANDFIAQYINGMVPLPGLTTGIAAAYIYDKISDD